MESPIRILQTDWVSTRGQYNVPSVIKPNHPVKNMVFKLIPCDGNVMGSLVFPTQTHVQHRGPQVAAARHQVWQQDSTLSRRARSWLSDKLFNHITAKIWPPNLIPYQTATFLIIMSGVQVNDRPKSISGTAKVN